MAIASSPIYTDSHRSACKAYAREKADHGHDHDDHDDRDGGDDGLP
jgi:hypothetical protein